MWVVAYPHTYEKKEMNMGEIFTDTIQDNTDHTFSDTTQDTGQEIQTPADSSEVVNPPADTSVPQSPDAIVTPAPTETTEPPASGEDKPQENDTGGNSTVSCNCNISDLQSILTEIQTSQKDFEELTVKYQEETLENDKVLIEQSKNLLSVSSLLLLTVGFLSGILLARIVWRKL